MLEPSTRVARIWLHRYAVVTAGATAVLIFVGGVVTNTGSGMAVPDWPTTFGYNMFLYPWSQMVGGVLYEHSHRLIGSVVGLLTVGLALWLWRTDSRRWMQRLGLVAVAGVVVQGVLGGLRVVLVQHELAFVHGCLAQAFFGLMVALAVCTAPSWEALAAEEPPAEAQRLRTLALLLVALVYLQIVFGAMLTHTGMWLHAHLLGAVLVTFAVSRLAGPVMAHAPAGALRRPALVLMVLLAAQLGLGLGAYLWRFTALREAMPDGIGLALQTTHRLTGALVLGSAVVMSLRILRILGVMQTMTEQTGGVQPPFGRRLGADEQVPA